MNLRQKAKYYKKKYMQNKVNYYDRTLFPTPTIQTEQIVSSTILPAEEIIEAGADADDMIASFLVNGLKSEIKPYIKVSSIYHPFNNTYQFYGSLRVVKGVEHGI